MTVGLVLRDDLASVFGGGKTADGLVVLLSIAYFGAAHQC
jgi:hypothetical protein